FVIFGIIPLQAFYKLNPHNTCQKWIFTVSFLSTSPARIAENIHVRRPKSQALITATLISADKFVVLRSTLITNSGSNVKHQCGVKSSGKAYRLREYCGAPRTSYAMERLIPPLVLRHINMGDLSRSIHHL